MKWLNDYYVGERAAENEKKIVKSIRSKRPRPDAYILTIASNPRNQVDILRADFLKQPFFRKDDGIVVIGIAQGQDDALDLMMQLTDECMQETGSADVRSYLQKRIRTGGVS